MSRRVIIGFWVFGMLASFLGEAMTATIKLNADDPSIVYLGNWTTVEDPAAFGGSYKIADERGATATFKFNGTSIRWIGKFGNKSGLANVYLDDIYQGVVFGLDNPEVLRTVLYEKVGLPDGPHTLRIECLGEKIISGTQVVIEALEVNFEPQSFVSEVSPSITYEGKWETAKDSSALENAYKYTTSADAFAEGKFTGGSIKWIAPKKKDGGYADVYIDDVFDSRVDLYSPEPFSQQVVYEKSGLRYAAHQIKIVPTGTRNVSSTGNVVSIDALEPNISIHTVEDNGNPKIVYAGNWNLKEDANAYNETLQSSAAANASAEYRFSGRSISWLATIGKDKGMADVYLDGEFQQTVDLYHESTEWQKTVFEKKGLSDAVHSIKIVGKGEKNASSSGTEIDVDAFGVNLKPLTKVDNLYGGITYGGQWARCTNEADYAGTYANTSEPGAFVQLEFSGTTLGLAGRTNRNMGLADVYVDDVLQGTADFYSEVPLIRQVVFEKSGLPSGKHTAKVVCKGEKNKVSEGTGIYLDYFEVDNASPLYGETGTEKRYLVFGEWNWPYPTSPTVKQFKANASFARQIGFNVIRVHIPWFVVQTGADAYNFSILDEELDYIVNVLQMPAAIVVDLTVLRDNPTPLSVDELQNGGEIKGMFNRTPFSWSSPTAVAKANDILGRIVSRYHQRYPAGSMLFCTATFAQYIESEGWNAWSDTGKCSVDAFRKWCEAKYSTIDSLNALWGTRYASFEEVEPPASFEGNHGLAWYQFKHSKLKLLLDSFADTVFKASEGTIKFAPQFGSVWDGMSIDRTTFAFTDLVASGKIQMVITDDAPNYNHMWTMDLLRGSLPGKWVSNETDGPWNGYLEVYYEIQTAQSFLLGANVVSMANWDAQVFRFRTAAWLAVDAAASFLPYKVPTTGPNPTSITLSAYEVFRKGGQRLQGPWANTSLYGTTWVDVKLVDDLSKILEEPPPTPSPPLAPK